MQRLEWMWQKISRPVFYVPLLVFCVLFFIHFWYMILHPLTVLYGGPGDHTAGLIWLNSTYPASPWWGMTGQTSYPWGENLWSPLFILGQVEYILYWICTKITGDAVGGYNLFTSLAFTLSFAVSYVFIYKRLLQKPLVASLAAAVMTFTPMSLNLDAVGHVSYLFFPAYLILSLWLVLYIFEGIHNLRASIILGILTGGTLLFDPYFVLFIPFSIVLFGLSLFLSKYHLIFFNTTKKLIKSIIITASVAAIVASLVASYLFMQHAAVAETTNASHGNILFQADIYSARLKDYLLPAASHPLVPSVIADIKKNTLHGGDATFTLFLGYTLLLLGLGAVILRLRYKAATPDSLKKQKVGTALLFLSVAAFITSLPPVLHLGSTTLHMPTYFITELASIWRVFARFYFVLQPALLLFVLYTLAETGYFHKRHVAIGKLYVRKTFIIVACLILLCIEYLPRNPFDTNLYWSYENSIPSTYRQLKSAKIMALAEFPIREQPYYRGSLYITGQYIHKKQMLNSYSPTSNQGDIRRNLYDLNNPQTIPILRALGVDTLIVWTDENHEWSPSNSAIEKIGSEEYHSKFVDRQRIDTYKINEQLAARRYMLKINSGYRPLDDGAITDVQFPAEEGSTIEKVDICQRIGRSSCAPEEKNLIFSVECVNSSNTEILMKFVSKNGDDVKEYSIPPGTKNVQFEAKSDVYTISAPEDRMASLSLKNQQILTPSQ